MARPIEVTTPLYENIRNQPQALGAVAEYQFGGGRAGLEQAAALLRSKKRVVLSGMGASLFACQALPYELARQGMNAVAIDTAELLYFTPAVIDSDTAVVLISRSGESVEVLKALPRLREIGAAVIGVVNVPRSTLAQSADVTLVVSSPVDQMVAVQTYTGTLTLMCLVGAALGGELDAARKDLDDVIAHLNRTLARELEARAQWDDLLSSDAPLYILGRGPSLSSVSEGVLLMHETAKAAAVGMSVAQFRHGPVEAVDGRFRAVILGSQRATADLDEALAHDLESMGAKTRLLRCEGVPERFTQIGEVVPLQIAAYRKAELNGVTPGEFRWAPQVTTTEAGFGLQE